MPAAEHSVIANSFGFSVDIDGCPEASKNIRDISIDELTIDSREITSGVNVEYRVFGPGASHWGLAKFTSAVTHGGSKEFKSWFDHAATGKGIRKNITVTLFNSDKKPGRSFNLIDCFPTMWTGVGFDTTSTVDTETLTVSVGRIEFGT